MKDKHLHYSSFINMLRKLKVLSKDNWRKLYSANSCNAIFPYNYGVGDED